MLKSKTGLSTKRHLIVVSKVVVTPKGSAVTATRLGLSREGVDGLQSKSSGIKSNNDTKEPRQCQDDLATV
jgi:hypothetical protein